MKRHAIRDAADIARIESAPYVEFMAHGSVYRALQATAARVPERAALVFLPSGDLATAARQWSYVGLIDEINRAARLFRRLAGADTPRVGLLLPAIPQAHFALWGAEAVGLACPLNYLLGEEHLAGLLRAAGCNILVALGARDELDLAPKVSALRQACPGLRHVLRVGGDASLGDDFDALCAAESAQALDMASTAQRDTPAALFHTGGTTGLPKLAQHTHGNQLHSAWGAALMYATTEDDRIVNGFPIFHVAGTLVFGLSTLLAGGAVILPTLLGMRNAAFMGRYWSFVEREAATLVTATPTGIATLMAVQRGGADIRSVRALLTGGAPLPSELARAFEQQTGIPVRNTLGMTESAGVIAIEPAAGPRVAGASDPLGAARRPPEGEGATSERPYVVSCGLPLPFVRVEIAPVADPAHGAPRTEPGAPGILRIRGPNVSPGYTDAARNAGSFENGWLLSGDIGHLDADGRVFVTGRAKDVIIRNSHNIDPGLIEDALLEHPQVALAAAVGQPDAYAGEVPVVFVVAKPGAQLDAGEVLRFVEPRIAERPAMPKRIEIMPALPQTAIGKVYKPALRALAAEHVLRERLAEAGLADRVSVRVDDQAPGLQVVFIAASAPPEAELGRLMQPYALRWRVEPG